MRPLLALVLLALAGCAGPPALPQAAPPATDPGPDFAAPAVAFSCADGCFEPSVAVDALGRVFATTQRGDVLARSTDGGATFEALPAPPLPAGTPPPIPVGPPGTPIDRYGSILNRADALVQTDAQGRLWWSALVAAGQGMQVARSDDGGGTWAVNAFVSYVRDVATPAPGLVDRQWMGFGPQGEAYLTFSHVPTGLWIARSLDGGATFGPWVRFAPVEERRAIGFEGAPAVDAQGRVLVPYLQGPPFLGGRLAPGQGFAVRLGVSSDGGATWDALDVHAPAGGERASDSSPVLAIGPEGALHVAWIRVGPEDAKELLVASSRDGGRTWSAPAAWAAGADAVADPALKAGPLGLRLAWRDAEGGLRIAWGPTERLGQAEAAPAMDPTHFVPLALDPDGRAVAAYAAGGTVGVVREAGERQDAPPRA